jgi:hypothetical protein
VKKTFVKDNQVRITDSATAEVKARFAGFHEVTDDDLTETPAEPSADEQAGQGAAPDETGGDGVADTAAQAGDADSSRKASGARQR